MKYRKKPVLTEATQWFQNGDHPEDHTVPVTLPSGNKGRSEGRVVGFFRRLNIPDSRVCSECGHIMQQHGLLNGVNGEETVHPGDYVVTDQKGRYYRLRPRDFEALYELCVPAPHPPPQG